MSDSTGYWGRTRVKMCGLTRAQDIEAAVSAGADALGFVFYPKSKRYVTVEQARSLRQQIPAFVQTVALFVNAKPAFIRQVIEQVQPDLLQFHGEESVAFCESFNHPYIRAFRVGGPGMETAQALLARCQLYDHAQAWLFDSYSPQYGGSGLRFDEQLLEAVQKNSWVNKPKLILAGGVDLQNIRQQIQKHRPYAVDISSAIEDAPGLKNPIKIRAFMQQLNQ